MYMFCFGVELSVNNVMVSYLGVQFNLPLAQAGCYASIFGCVTDLFSTRLQYPVLQYRFLSRAG